MSWYQDHTTQMNELYDSDRRLGEKVLKNEREKINYLHENVVREI